MNVRRSRWAGLLIVAVILGSWAATCAQAQFTWDGTGTFASAVGSNTLASGTTLAITTTNNHDFNGTAIVINGTVNWTAGNLRSGNSGSITNNATWNDGSTDQQFNNDYGGSVTSFTNAATGTYNKSAAGQTNFYVPFYNAGALVLTTGKINFEGGGNFSGAGSINAGSGTTVYFNSNYAVPDASQLSGSGDYVLLNGALDLSGVLGAPGFKLQGGTLTNSQTFNSTVPWTGTDLNTGGTTTIGTSGVFAITASVDHNFNTRALVNNGTVNWTAGNLRSGNGGTITNNAAWNDASTGQQFNNDYGGTVFTFTNSATGTYTKSAAGQTNFYVPFNNAGALILSTGSLNLQGGGSFSATGTATAATGTTLFFNSNYSISNGASLLGGGSYQLISSTLTMSGTVSVNNFILASGQLAGTQTFAGGVSWTGTDLNTGGTTTNGAGSTLTISTGVDHNFNTRALVNNGTVNWTAGNLRSGNGGTITNNAAWNDTSTDQQFNNDYGGTVLTFTNGSSGTYTKSAAGQTNFYVPFYNAGALVITTGRINLEGGGSFSGAGSVSAASGTTLYFNSGYTIPDASRLTGSGDYLLINGSLDLSGVLGAPGFKLQGGQLTNSQTFNSTIPWTGTDLNTGGTTTIGTSGVFAITASVDHNFNTRALVNNGTVNWTAGNLRSGNGGTITNNAAWNDTSTDQQFNNDYGGTVLTFTNGSSGTYTKSAAGQTNFYVPFYNAGALVLTTGTMNLQGGGGFSGTGSATIASGTTLFFNSNYSISNGASLLGGGSYQLISSTLTMSGTVSVNNFILASGQLAGTQTFAGGVNWTGTDLNTGGTTTNGAGSTLTISTGVDHNFNTRALVNNGTVNWTAGNLRSGNGGTITNNAAWNDTSTDQQFNNDYGGTVLTFTNGSSGTYTKSAAGQTNFYVPFYNAGTITVANGILVLNGGGTISAGAQYDGAGQTLLNSGTFAASGLFTSTNLVLGGSANLAGNSSLGGTFTWTSGNFNNGSTTTVPAGATLAIATGADHDFNSHAFVNNGTVSWTAGRLRSGNSGLFTNNALFNDTASYELNNDYQGAAWTFVNASSGTYNKTATGTTIINIPFNNAGTVTVATGTLALHAGGTISGGALYNGAGQTLLNSGTFSASGLFTSTNLVLGGTANLTGSASLGGTFTWTSGNFNNASTTTIPVGAIFLITTGADHDFNAHGFVNNGTVNWTAGRLRSGNSGSILNTGTWNDSASSDFNNDYQGASAAFTNNGQYNKTGLGTTTFSIPVTNTGTISIAAGTMVFNSTFTNSGTIALANGANAQFSGPLTMGTAPLSGTGTISAPSVTAGGVVSPGNSPGTLTLTGDLTLLGTSTLLIELGGTTQGSGYDFLSVGGSAVVAGGLSLTFANGFQSAVLPANTFTVLTAAGAGGLTGTFANIPSGQRLTTLDGFGSFQVNYGAGSAYGTNNLVLSNFVVSVPEPSTYLLLGLGSLAVLAGRRRRKSS